MINLTPGGFGIKEAVLMFSSEVIGVSSHIILLKALVIRGISILRLFSAGGISYLILNYRLNRSQDNISK